MPAPAHPKRRELLIALNAADTVHRPSLCRLALELDLWADAPADGEIRNLVKTLGVPPEPLRRALTLRSQAREIATAQLERAEREGCRIVTLLDDDYPTPLWDLGLPPPVLYCRGEIPGGPAVAIVGSRKMSPYGREAAKLFGGQLAAAGVVVVSGFARGVDRTAHESAVNINGGGKGGGASVAVLGCGLDVDYPKGQTKLAEALARSGAVVSEFAFGAPPRRWHFPMRNRVIAALAGATLVIQAKPRSGSLITAHHALELGRDVYAVPGPIFDDLSMGTNALIADGAYLAASPDDLLDGLGLGLGQQSLFESTPIETAPRPPRQPLTAAPDGLGGKILEALEPGEEKSAEELAEAVGKDVDRVLGALLELELAGWLERRPGALYGR